MLLFCLYHKAGGDASGKNIFEHNEEKLFGRSRTDSAAEDQEPPGM